MCARFGGRGAAGFGIWGEGGGEEEGLFDSVAGEEDGGGAYGSMEELFVANPRAILPCFVVIYRVAAPSC